MHGAVRREDMGMANILDYMDWRGDLSFSESPFNEVDNLILSELVFLDFTDVVPSGFSESVTLKEAILRLNTAREAAALTDAVLLPADILPLAEKCAESRRFGEIGLCGFQSRTDTRCELQFAAVTFLLGDGTAFAAFRGTDDTLVGWKEDFNMTFLPVVPSQAIASRYLSSLASVYALRLRVGGHSKGGNLAIYAAATLSAEQRRRIVAVYNNDGPGFSGAFLDSDGYRAIRDRVRIIVPDTSIIGMLLEHAGVYTVVRSSKSGFRQHDGFSWEVRGNAFVTADDRTDESKFIDRTLKGWLTELSDEDREAFIDAVYGILLSASAETLAELRADREALRKILRGFTPERRRVIRRMLIDLIAAGQRVRRADRDEKREEKRVKRELTLAERRMRKKQRTDRAAEIRKRRDRRAVHPIRFRFVTVAANAVHAPQGKGKQPREGC